MAKLNKIMVYFIAFIMISSIFGVIFYGFKEETNELKYDNINFKQVNGQWVTNIDGKKLTFDYFPGEVESLNVSGDIITAMINSYQLDITSDQDSLLKEDIALASYDISQFFGVGEKYIRLGFTEENTTLPKITCDEFTGSVPIIYFRFANQTKVYFENGCIMADAKTEFDILRIKDRMLYGIKGIIA